MMLLGGSNLSSQNLLPPFRHFKVLFDRGKIKTFDARGG